MKIVLISGLSGSGKSVALKLLEDSGFYCVDNMPLELLPDLVRHHIAEGRVDRLGVSVDIRSRVNIEEASRKITLLRRQGHDVEILFLEASEAVLLRRFSETRRAHPLADATRTLQEALALEKHWLFPLREMAFCLDTSAMNAQRLRHAVRHWLGVMREGLMVVVESFGFKHGLPANADFVFDMRSLPNPFYDEALRPLSGLDLPVRDYLSAQPEVGEMVADLHGFLHRWLPRMENESRSYVTIAIGCTGGQHRSVYVAERLAELLRGQYPSLVVRHLQLA